MDKGENKLMDKEALHVVLALQDKTGDYSRHTGVVMQSLLKNTKSKIHFHIFHDETLSSENMKNFKAVADLFSMQINFHNIQLPLNPEELKAIKCLSIGTLYRLEIANQLKGIDRALYLDSDIVVALDVAEFFEMDLGNHLIAAVHDDWIEQRGKRYLKSVEFNLKAYFNAGVMLFDLQGIRKEHDLLRECLDFLKKYPQDLFSDQSALNYVFDSRCKLINQKYNAIPNLQSKKEDKSIWHFAGGYKPWETRMHEVDSLYWEYLSQTPWGNTMEKIFAYYSKTVEPLDVALLKYPTGSKRGFFKSVFIRSFREIKEIKTKMFD